MKVVFSPRAEQDLEQIAETIAADNPRRALQFIRELREFCFKTSQFP